MHHKGVGPQVTASNFIGDTAAGRVSKLFTQSLGRHHDMTDSQPAPTTTDAGIPVESDEHSLTIGPDGPILLRVR